MATQEQIQAAIQRKRIDAAIAKKQPQQQEESQGFFGNVADAFVDRGIDFGKNMFNVKKDLEEAGLNPVDAYQAISRGNRRIAGVVGGGMADIVGEGILSAGKTVAELTPDFIKDPIAKSATDIAQSEFGQGVGSAIKSVGEIYAGFKNKNPELAQDIADVANIGGALLPIKGINKIPGAIETAAGVTKEIVRAPLDLVPQSKTKQKIAELIAEGSDDTITAPYQIKEKPRLLRYLNVGKDKIEGDSLAKSAITQGFDKGVVAVIKGATPADKGKMLKMVESMQRSKENAKSIFTSRPGDVVGDSFLERFKYVRNINMDAGIKTDITAKKLKGQAVDIDDPVNSFLDDIRNLGINIDESFNINFEGSDFEAITGAENTISNIFNRMKNTKIPDAYDAHRLKRYIDEQVTYGKAVEGLSGRASSVLKKLRNNIDTKLDETFPEYNEVNTIYAETINALDNFQNVAGKTMNLSGGNADKAVGTLLRRLMSNQQSRVRLIDSVGDIDGLAAKYKGNFNDDILTQVLFVDELDSVFKPIARTSLQGQMGQAIERTARASRSIPDAVATMAGKAADKARGINEDAAFKSIRKLLKRK